MSDAGQPWLHNRITVLSAPTMVLSEQGRPARRMRLSSGSLAAQLPGAPLRVDGLVAGAETLSAGVDADATG